MSDNAAGGCGGAAVDRIHVDQKQGETAADRSRCDAFVDQLQREEEETADENCRGGAAVDRIHVLRGASAPSGLDILANIGKFFVIIFKRYFMYVYQYVWEHSGERV